MHAEAFDECGAVDGRMDEPCELPTHARLFRAVGTRRAAGRGAGGSSLGPGRQTRLVFGCAWQGGQEGGERAGGSVA